ncbi:MAG: hypothetical protein JOZ75_13710 [Candidatus Dormibacteraeota bacterium]|nr:hypothetical protein [Candidatus Dormibacteraeota bacterium]
MTEELPGTENATWLEGRLGRRSTPSAPEEPAKGQRVVRSPEVLRPSSASTTAPRPAARLLHAPPPFATAGRGGLALAGRSIFAPSFALRAAQLAVAAQSVIALTTGINLIRGSTSIAQLGSGVNLPATPSLAAHYGIAIVMLGALMLTGAVVVSYPSQIVRTLLVVIEVVALGLTLAAHFGGGSVLGFATVIGTGATGSALIPFGAVVGLQSAVVYLLAIHPPTYGGFAR